MVHILMTNPSMNFLAPNSTSSQQLPPTVQWLLMQTSKKIVYAHESVPPGPPATQLLTNNLHQYIVPDTLSFEGKAIRWYCELLLHHDKADNMTGFDNEILIAYGMCPPCKLQEYYQLAPENCPTHFMRGTAAKFWGDDMHKVMYTSAADCIRSSTMSVTTLILCQTVLKCMI
jgi:hypothetical protein